MQKGMAGVLCLILALTSHAQISNCLSHWTWRNPLPQGNSLAGVAYGHGTYVAVGQSGIILTSTNRSDWVQRHSAGSNLSDIVFADGKFVAVGGEFGAPLVSVSTNAVDWEDQLVPITSYPFVYYPFNAVAYGNGRFVAVGGIDSFPRIAVSTNGKAWSIVTITNRAAFESIAFGNGRFVAVGEGGAAFVSTNGTAWQAGNTGFSNWPLNTVSFLNDRFVAASWGGFPTVSSDGLAWAFDSSLPPAQIIHTNGLFLAPFQNSILVSTDAQNWITNVVMESTLSRIATDGNGAVGVGVGGVIVASSNLHDWDPIGSVDRAVTHLISYGAGRFVAARGGASMITSTDGRTWNDSTNLAGAGSIFDLLFAEDRFWSVARGPATNGSISTQVFSSNDGVQWHQLFRTNDFPLHYFAYGAGQAVAVGGHDHPNPGYPDVATSSDLSNWHCQRLTNWGNGAFFDVAFGNGVFVAAGWKEYQPPYPALSQYYGLIAHSTDGTNWSGAWNWDWRPIGKIAYGNGMFLATEADHFQISTNGTNWMRIPGLSSIRHLSFARGTFIVIGPEVDNGSNPYIGLSATGSNWVFYPLPTRWTPMGIAAGPRSFFIVGLNGMILESDPFRQPTIGFRRDSATTWTLPAEMEPHFPHLLEWSTDMQNWQPGQSITSTNGLFATVQTFSNTPAQFYRIRSP